MSTNQLPPGVTAILPHAPGNSGPQPGGGVGITAAADEDAEATLQAISEGVVDLLTDAEIPTEAPEGRGRHSLIRDTYDDATYQHSKEEYPRLMSGELAATEKLTTAPDLLQDLFASFNQRQPIAVDPSKLTKAHQVNHEIMQEVMSTEQWAELRANGTIGDDLNSAIATIATGEALVERMTEAERQQINELADAEAQAQGLTDLGDELSAQADATGDRSWRTKASKARARAQQQQARADQLANQLSQHGAARRDAMRRAGRKAMEQAQQDMQSLAQASEAFGGPGTGAGSGLSGMPLKDKIALARKMRGNAKLARLAELIGRLRSLASALQNAKVDHSPSEIADIALGADLPYVLPDEYAMLGDPDLELVFIANYVEETLLQYQLHGEDKVGKGPMIVAVDESGSMGGVMASEHGASVTRELWSKAVALALLAVARQQKRDFAFIHFADASELRVDVYRKGNAEPAKLIDTAEHFFGGGTDYEGWMGAALDLIDRSRFDKADVVLISDGEANVSDDMALAWARAQHTRHFRTFGVLISSHYGKHEGYGGGVLEQICDAVIPISSLGNEREALQTILSV